METGLIYTIFCTINKQRYVGLTTQDVSKRWKEHITQAKNNPSSPLHKSIAKYGSHNHKVRILESDIPIDDLPDREIHWIAEFDTFNNGYNQTTGGETSKTIHENVKEKISDTMLGVSKSEDHTNKVKKTLKEKSIVEPWGALLPENRGDGIHLRRKVRATDVKTKEVKEWESLTQAMESLGRPKNHMSSVIRAIKKGYMCYGYTWEYADDNTYNKPVKGYGKWSGELAYEFESMRQAGLFFGATSGRGVSRSLRNPGKSTYKGCYWYYA